MNRKSYTLVELMVVVAIFTLILGSLYLLFEKGKSINQSLGAGADLLTSGRAAMHQLITDLNEAKRNTLTGGGSGEIPSFTDPLNSETHQILIFASARGDSAVASEDSVHSNNNYVHLDIDNRPSWRSAVIYCTYVTPNGLQQLRKYVDYGSSVTYYSQSGIFPFSLNSVTSTNINLTSQDGTKTLSISRSSGTSSGTYRVIANYISTEDADNDGILDAVENDGNDNMPADNQDGVLDRGVDFSVNSGLLEIKLFLAKPETSLTINKRYLVITLSGSAVMRN